MFQKILVPLDGSELAARMLPQVIELARCMKSQVTLLHVCHLASTPGPDMVPPAIATEADERERKWCAAFLGEAAKELQGQGIDVHTECVEGVPAREIIAYAENNGVDLIAMATHGRGEVAWILGSTAEKVVTHATVPTLLFRVIKMKSPGLKDVVFKDLKDLFVP